MEPTSMNQKVADRNAIVYRILSIIGIAGLVVTVAVCPNLLQLIPRETFKKKSFKQALQRVDKRGWILIQKNKNGWQFLLSEKGREELLKYEYGLKKLNKNHKWDGKWRVFVFDIPEGRRSVRDRMRTFLINLGFYRLQKSVWIYPFECREVLELLRTGYKIRHEVIYLRAEYFEGDQRLRKIFGLL